MFDREDDVMHVIFSILMFINKLSTYYEPT
jgi:hypothetical protein